MFELIIVICCTGIIFTVYTFEEKHKINKNYYNQKILKYKYIEFSSTRKYKIMQHTDNDYFLGHDENGKYSVKGSIFLDYNNESDLTDKNIIIYGHNMKDGSMFGSLRNYVYGDYKDYISKNSTFKVHDGLKENTYKIFLTNIISAQNDNYIYNIYSSKTNRKEFNSWKEKLVKKYIYKEEMSTKKLKDINQVIVLSTCFDSTDKRIIVAGYNIDE